MSNTVPLNKSIEDLQDIVERIASTDSPVGIDAKLTHAIIIDYLRHIASRVEAIERRLEADNDSRTV